MKYFKYVWYVIRHKWFVFVECCKLGIPWRGVVHDLSKLLPSELVAYTWSFYGGFTYETRPQELVDAFDRAWLGHIHRNPHHWQYWILTNDSEAERVLAMPDAYRREMVADWIGAGIAITGKKEVRGWYDANKDKMRLHSETRKWVEEFIEKQ